MIAAFIFSLSGYIIHIGLGRYFGPEEYGIIGVIISILTIINLIFTSGITPGVSKYLSENKKWSKNLITKSIYIQLILSIFITIILIILAPLISKYLNDMTFTYYIRLAALTIPFYAFFALYHRGFLNGYRMFKEQAITRISFSITKVTVVFLFVFLCFGIESVIFGYLSA
ncbi:MAG: oligosaccharide flippase family protein, partial [Candidatus Lokiarchaeota archaeon]|nr:oligosaccharide flippase family protein [Candidatus Lokiarchaeota archaeon]